MVIVNNNIDKLFCWKEFLRIPPKFKLSGMMVLEVETLHRASIFKWTALMLGFRR
jgi:hypothetical protein